MLIVQLPGQKLSFEHYLREIIFDNPPKHPESAISAEIHNEAFQQLKRAANQYGVKPTSRDCGNGCKCSDYYKGKATANAFIV